MILLTLCILSIITSWVFNLPHEWAVAITVLASLGIFELAIGFAIKDN